MFAPGLKWFEPVAWEEEKPFYCQFRLHEGTDKTWQELQ